MKLYNMLAMNEGAIKRKIHESESAKGKLLYFGLLVLRAFLIVAFAVLYVSIMTAFFGSENSAMAVVLLVTTLTIRFVHFKYCIGDTLITLATAIAIFVFAPYISLIVPAGLVFFVHFFAIIVLMCIACQKPQMGLGGMIGFAYVYLTGNPATGDALLSRAGMAVVGYIILAAVMIHQHRGKDKDVRFHHFFKQFDVSTDVNIWHIRFALGLAIVLTFGELLDIPRFTWIGFACSTMLAKYPYTNDEHARFVERIEGVFVGSVAFVIVCQFIPGSFIPMLGLISGFFLAFCAKYRWKTIIICFGPLSSAVSLFGIGGSAFLRILNNILGATFALIFTDIYDNVVQKIVLKNNVQKEPAT